MSASARRQFCNLFSVASVIAACSEPVPQQTSQVSFTAVVGNWSEVDDGGKAHRVDGTVWDGGTDSAHVAMVARSLFRVVNDTFMSNGLAAGAFPHAVVNGIPDFTSGALKAQFKLVGGESDQIAGIVFDLKPNGEYQYVRYNTRDGNLALWRYSNGERSVTAKGEDTTQLPLNVWHDLVVTIAGTALTAEANGGVLSFAYRLDAPVSGRVGVWAKRDAVTLFRNFTATP
jgi:hypothetical protein